MDRSGVRGRRFSVIGGARSGIAVARLLKQHGATVFLSDSAPPDQMSDAIKELEQIGVESEFGENSEKILDADAIVLSPGVPDTIPILQAARSKAMSIFSEPEVASWFCAAPMIAVTGTNGKTTTTTLIGKMFEDAHKPSMTGGNIGTPFSRFVDDLDSDSTAVLEVSSFQLDHIDSFRPKVSVILNITPDHLDRYEDSFERYVRAKCRVFENQRNGDMVVYNGDEHVTRDSVERGANSRLRKLPFSIERELDQGAFVKKSNMVISLDEKKEEIIPTNEIGIKGKHNLQNAMAATLVGASMGIPSGSIRSTLRNFKGVKHRLEFVRELTGIVFVNDSKATNVDSVRYALGSFSGPIILMLGGRDKGNDYTKLHEPVRSNVKSIIAIGESADKVVRAFSEIVPVRKASSMNEAVGIASSLAERGDTVLLSPACASFDWFNNYEHRGEVFRQEVARL